MDLLIKITYQYNENITEKLLKKKKHCYGGNACLTSVHTCFIQEALQSIATDPGLYQMLPRFSTFISEGVSFVFFFCFINTL